MVTKTIAGVGVVLVGGVFAPCLADVLEIGDDLGTSCCEEGSKDAAFWVIHHGVDTGESLGPRATEEFAEYCFCLVVEGVGCRYGIDYAVGHELAEPGVAETAGGFFDGFAMLGGFGSGIDLMGVKDEAKGACEF